MNVADEIEKLIKLRDRGVLTQEEFQELKAYTLGMESTDPARVSNTDQPPLATKTSNPQNTYLKAAVGLLSVIACIALGIWIAQKTNDNTVKTDTEAKSEAEQKQAASDEAFEKMLAENKKGAEKIMANSRNSEAAQTPETSPTPAPEPVQEPPETQQTPQVTPKEPEPAKETASPPKEETTATKPVAELITYSSPATPYVNQMVEAAKDTETSDIASLMSDISIEWNRGKANLLNMMLSSAIFYCHSLSNMHLNLPSITVSRVEEINGHDYHVYAVPAFEPQFCRECVSTALYGHGSKTHLYMDTPMHCRRLSTRFHALGCKASGN